MDLSPIITRQQAALARVGTMRRMVAAAEQRVRELQNAAGAAMLADGKFSTKLDGELARAEREVTTAQLAVDQARAAVAIAEAEDAQETIARDRTTLVQMLDEREAASAEIMDTLRGLPGAAARLIAAERAIAALTTTVDSVQGPEGWMVHPGADGMRDPGSFTHRMNLALLSILPDWRYDKVLDVFGNAGDLATSAQRERQHLLDFFEVSAPEAVRNRMTGKRTGNDAAAPPTTNEAGELAHTED